MRPKVTVKAYDSGFDVFKDTIAALAKERPELRVGVFDDSIHFHPPGSGGNDKTTAEIAAINEYGTRDGHVPERSFMRSTLDDNLGDYAAMLRDMMYWVVNGKGTIENGLKVIGRKIVVDMQAKIHDRMGVEPANAPATVQRKKSDHPLIDTARMFAAISFTLANKQGRPPGGFISKVWNWLGRASREVRLPF